jgi:hypothetical protein
MLHNILDIEELFATLPLAALLYSSSYTKKFTAF